MFAVVRTLLFGGLAGKVLGVARELVGAWLFGTGPVAAAFRLSQAAFLIPLQGFVAEALNSGFTPRFGMHRRDNPERATALFSAMHCVLVGVAFVVAIFLFVLADLWVRLLAPGLDDATRVLAVQMVQLLAIAMPPYLATALYAAANLVEGGGQLMASRASAQSVGLLLGTVVAWWAKEPIFIAVGFVASYFAMFVWGVVLMRQMKLPLWPARGQFHAMRSALGEAWHSFRWLLGVPLIMQVHFIVERRVASVVHAGALAALDYARFVSDTAVVLLAVPFGLAGLGAMASMDERTFRESAARSLRVLTYVGIPVSALLVAHANLVVKLLFARGAFNADSVAVTSAILLGIGGGIWCQLLGYTGAKFLSARGDNRSVLLAMSLAVAVNVAANLLLSDYLGPEVLGISSAANALLFGLLVMWRLKLIRVLAPDLIGLLLAACLYCAAWWWAAPPLWNGQLAMVIVGAVVFWCLALLAIPRHRAALMDIGRMLKH